MKAQQGTPLGIAIIAALFALQANAECPQTLPTDLLKDCIVIEGSGSSFPHPDYAHKAAYETWLAQRAQSNQPAAGPSSSNPGMIAATAQ